MDGNNEKVIITVSNGIATMTTSTQTLVGELRDTTITVTNQDGTTSIATITKGDDAGQTEMVWDDPSIGGKNSRQTYKTGTNILT